MEITLPKRIGHPYTMPVLLNIEDIHKEPLCSHRRLRVFHEKGLKCHYCDKTGIYLISAVDRFNGIHIDLYTKDFELMTIDHVVPKCKGGGNELHNLLPSCTECNTAKGGKDYKTFVEKANKQLEIAWINIV
jgi:5-methylcytosine-specific restriction endonuclease McrA